MTDVVPMLDLHRRPGGHGPAGPGLRLRGTDQAARRRRASGSRRADDRGRLAMIASTNPAYESPTAHRQHCEAADAWLISPYVVDGALVYVDDIDAHYARAVAAGAATLSEIEDGTGAALPHRGPRGAPLDVHAAAGVGLVAGRAELSLLDGLPRGRPHANQLCRAGTRRGERPMTRGAARQAGTCPWTRRSSSSVASPLDALCSPPRRVPTWTGRCGTERSRPWVGAASAYLPVDDVVRLAHGLHGVLSHSAPHSTMVGR